MELDSESISKLKDYWINQRNYARDCRWTQRKYLKEQPKRKDFWKPRILKYDKRYKHCDKKLRELRKL
jgi:hypothetical protein